MAKIVVEQFQLYRVPQSLPGSAENPINKVMPKLREQRFNPLTHTAVKFSLFGHIPARYQQQFTLICKQLSELWSFIAQISKQYPSIYRLSQFKGWISIIDIAGSQNSIHNAPVDITQGVELKAEEPPRASFAKVCPIFSEQSHTTVTNRLTDRDGLGISKVESDPTSKASRLKQPAYDRTEPVQASNPLLIRTDEREGRSIVIVDKIIGLLERIYSDTALHQGNCNDLSISEGWFIIRRTPPMSQTRMCFKEVIDKAVDLSHLIYNGSQMGRPPGVEMGFATSFYTPSGL
jgi:hypothetical protein